MTTVRRPAGDADAIKTHHAARAPYDLPADRFCRSCGTAWRTLRWMGQLEGDGAAEWQPYLDYHLRNCEVMR